MFSGDRLSVPTAVYKLGKRLEEMEDDGRRLTRQNNNMVDDGVTPMGRMADRHEGQEWFALKVGRKEARAESILEMAGLRVYAPRVEVSVECRGKTKIVMRPLIPNTLFAYTSFGVLNAIRSVHPFITYSYKKVDGKFKILKIPAREMERFIDSSAKMQDDITYFRPDEVELQKGDRVRIVGGVFDGYEGTLLKAKGRAKRMFVVNFELLGALGTHIEPEYIQLVKRHCEGG